MVDRKNALITWIPTEKGGKRTFPSNYYSTAAHFRNDEPRQDWSVNLEVIKKIEKFKYLCYIEFLFPESAPSSLLVSGSKFELFEAKKVADGEVL
ncbi:hypothetical protein [Cohnella sp. GCM10012308]|uniref:hypothetical protein n=1 Tax=Cohnella sp. GCM10012308 TaxID=3317329 RepID=UPI00361A40AD